MPIYPFHSFELKQHSSHTHCINLIVIQLLMFIVYVTVCTCDPAGHMSYWHTSELVSLAAQWYGSLNTTLPYDKD